MSELKRTPQEIFAAGWHAAQAYADHEWGPAPPDSPSKAYAKWLGRCSNGHIMPIKGCICTLPDGRHCGAVKR
jgi:hypothetical protein